MNARWFWSLIILWVGSLVMTRLFVIDFTTNPVLILLSIPGVIIFIALRPVRVKSSGPVGSMYPTMSPGDFILMDGLIKTFRKPLRRGDIILFFPPREFMRMSGERDPFIKRIIGVAGDSVRVAAGQVSVNDQELKEPYTHGKATFEIEHLKDIGGLHNQIEYYPYSSNIDAARKPIIVPTGKLFVLGDNRSTSVDSHIFGFIDIEDVHARYLDHLWRAPVLPPTARNNACSFCARDQTLVKLLIQADEDACICDSCVDSLFQQSRSAANSDHLADTGCHICRQVTAPLFGSNPFICRPCIGTCLELLQKDQTMCSFCSKGNLSVDLMVAGPPPLAICSTCLDEENREKWKNSATECTTVAKRRCDFCQKTRHPIAKQANSIELCSDCLTLCFEHIDRRRRICQLSEILATDKPSSEALMERGRLTLEDNQLAMAIGDLSRVIESTPRHCDALALRAKCYLNNRELNKALTDIERSLALNPNHYENLKIAGNIHAEINDYESAINALTKALAIRPDDG